MFQGQPDGVDILNDPVVEIHPDAFALLQDCQPALLDLQMGVFDRRANPERDGGEELHFQVIQRFGMTGGNAQHAKDTAAPVERETRHLVGPIPIQRVVEHMTV